MFKSHEAKDGHASIIAQKWMPQHFIDIGDRLETVWLMLQQQDTKVVALVGMGGVGRGEFLSKCSCIGGLHVSNLNFLDDIFDIH